MIDYIEKVKNASKYLLPAGLILYFLGFITLTSFLAKFGIVSFEIINARYIAAGLLALVSIMGSVWASWFFYQNVNKSTIFRRDNFDKRFGAYCWFISVSYLLSSAFSKLFELGKNMSGSEFPQTYYPIFGKYDFSWNILESLSHVSQISDYYTKLFIDILIPLIILTVLIFYIIQKFSKKSKKHEVSKTASSKSLQATPSAFWHLIEVLGEVLLIALITVLLARSINRYGLYIFTFKSFGQDTLSTDMFFSWFYSSSMYYVFILWLFSTFDKKKRKIKFTIGQDLHIIIQQAIVPFLTSIILFGLIIYPRISYSLGGGMPQKVLISTKVDIGVTKDQYQAYIIGETTSNYFIVLINKNNTGRAIEINKNEVNYLVTKNEK